MSNGKKRLRVERMDRNNLEFGNFFNTGFEHLSAF